MTFDPNARLDPGQITDRRGMGGRGGLAIGGGGIGVVLFLAYILLGGDPSSLGPLLEPGAVTGPGSTAIATDCKTGQDANTRDDCRILGYVNSIQAYWTDTFAASGKQYQPVNTILFSGVTSSGCGTASSSTGPFYCPTDRLVYLDLDFFTELRTRFGAQGGSLAQGYVLAHEYGHHVQDLLGSLKGGGGGEGAQGESVRTELQADCFAGVWANHAASTKFLEPITAAQIADALDAAAAVGDDRIQQASSGEVNPDTWTHGSSDQRKHWFTTGYQSGDPGACDTFNGAI
jgi:predicted metalloprotease